MPDTLVGWMLQAARESELGNGSGRGTGGVGLPEDDHQVREWNYRVVDGGGVGTARLVKADGYENGGSEEYPMPAGIQSPHWDPKLGVGKQYGVVPQSDGRYGR